MPAEWTQLLTVGLWLVEMAKAIAEAQGISPEEYDAEVVKSRARRASVINAQREAEIAAMEGAP